MGGTQRKDILKVVGLAENKANSALLGLQLRLNLTKSDLASAFEESVKLSASQRNGIIFAPTSNSPNGDHASDVHIGLKYQTFNVFSLLMIILAL